MPVALNVWQHVDAGRPAAAARRLIIASTTRRVSDRSVDALKQRRLRVHDHLAGLCSRVMTEARNSIRWIARIGIARAAGAASVQGGAGRPTNAYAPARVARSSSRCTSRTGVAPHHQDRVRLDDME